MTSNPFLKALTGLSRIGSLVFVLAVPTLAITASGCGGNETTVIEPQTYELTEQEQANRERAQKILAEQRQQ